MKTEVFVALCVLVKMGLGTAKGFFGLCFKNKAVEFTGVFNDLVGC